MEMNGFLKKVCMHFTFSSYDGIRTSLAALQCAHSNMVYGDFRNNEVSSYDKVCDNDPHFYQACGTTMQRKTILRHAGYSAGLLCSDYICVSELPYKLKEKQQASLCGKRPCNDRGCLALEQCDNLGEKEKEQICGVNSGSDELVSGELSVRKSRTCNGWCDLDERCEDEALCDGFVYGMFCQDSQGKRKYIMPDEICDGRPPYSGSCANNEDEADCPDLKTLPNREKCIPPFTQSNLLLNPDLIPILNRTRCTGVWSDNIPPYDKNLYPICENYLDQTNCTDPNRFEIIF
jgi:hypothetical protein